MDSELLAWKIRRHAVEMTHLAQASHIGSVLSVADIVAVLYGGAANVNPLEPKMEERDRIVLSKGHAGAAVYAALAETGFFAVEELKTHYADGSRLSGHVSHKGVRGVEVSTGSLGHGFSMAVGMALAAKRDGKKHRVYAICGDGECDEGCIWEGALCANQYRLGNLTAVIDHNRFQSLDLCENTLALEPLEDKWRAFGWNAVRIDGHDHRKLKEAFSLAKSCSQPTVVIADTVKGKGISFMENEILWHYRYPHDGWEYDSAREELWTCVPEKAEE